MCKVHEFSMRVHLARALVILTQDQSLLCALRYWLGFQEDMLSFNWILGMLPRCYEFLQRCSRSSVSFNWKIRFLPDLYFLWRILRLIGRFQWSYMPPVVDCFVLFLSIIKGMLCFSNFSVVFPVKRLSRNLLVDLGGKIDSVPLGKKLRGSQGHAS